MRQVSDATHQRALIAGSANGLGLGIVIAMLEQEAYVTIGDIDTAQPEDPTKELGNLNLWPLESDVGDLVSVRPVVDVCDEAFGGLDTLVNSTSNIRITPLDHFIEED